MSLTRIKVQNFKSIKYCNVSLSDMNLFIGQNGSGKSNLLEAIFYFYNNLTNNDINNDIFDQNNHFNNEVIITLTYDLSGFVKIAKANSKNKEDGDSFIETNTKYNGFYNAILALVSERKDNKISVEMSHVKGKAIKWNYSYNERQLIKSLFPVFSIDSRQLDVIEWEYIWDVLGELAKVSNHERKKMENNLSSVLLNPENVITKKLNRIIEIFDDADVSIKKSTSKIYAQKLTQIFFSGDKIYHKNKTLAYYSTGTNSVKYIELLLISIDELSKTKLKEPIILMDEPEISLHHQFIDELSTTISKLTSKSTIMLSTHSPRLTKNMIIKLDSVSLYNVKLINKYTYINKMKSFLKYSPNSKYRVTDEHINSYFSRMVIFVEGESELEFFANSYIKELFPILDKVDIYKAVSDKLVLDIINPKYVKSRIPYIILIDMDKALSYNIDRKSFEFKKEYISYNRNECYRYVNKDDDYKYLFHNFKRISAMEEKLKVKYYLPFYSTRDENYHEFLKLIKEYLLAYNVFAFSSTIEGAIINNQTYDITLKYLKKKCKESDYNEFYNILQLYPQNDRLNLLRYIFKGKSDLLQYKKIQKSNFKGREVVERIQGPVDKASGWISEFFEFYFANQTGFNEDFSIKNFKKFISNNESRKNLIKQFNYDFYEINMLKEQINKNFW